MGMTLSEELKWRGFVNQTTFDDINELDKKSISFYWGVDPSSDSMTIGNLAAAMMVRHFMSHGHQAYLLVGGATGLIGDPDGKKQERDLKTLEEIDDNKKALADQYAQVFTGMDFNVVDNYDWFKDINYLTFLRDIGKHLSMTQLLDREFVKNRIGEGGAGISYAEFSYSLIQGYDFLHLYKEHDVTLQVCGADQWGNSLAGVEMIRKIEGETAHVYSTPLIINKATGKKFGKSEEGAVWLDEDKTSVYSFYQFWLNVDDEGVGDYIKIYTLIKPDEFDKLMDEFRENTRARAAQKYLAYEVTKLVHGEDRANSVAKISDVIFGQGSLDDLSETDVQEMAKEIPTIENTDIATMLVESSLASSKSEARRFMDANAVSINDQKITTTSKLDEFEPVHGHLLLRRGKNKLALIKVT